MDAKQSHTPRVIAQILDLRIKGLDHEELAARDRCDWAAARNASLTRAPLKETRQRISVPKRR
jgi:hypothetical protein